jgi:polysaccharide biosynthesis/export protein
VTAKLRTLIAFGFALALAGCQSTLDPVVPANGAAYQAIALPQDLQDRAYVLKAGDLVGMSVYGEDDLALDKVQIDQSGKLTVPLIGQVDAAGRTVDELGKDIERAYAARFVRNPKVTVSLLESKSGMVAVEGEVKTPGVYPVRPGYTLLTSMALAGSPVPTARVDHVLIFRRINGQRMGGRFDLKAIRSGKVEDPAIIDGDVVVVGFSRRQGLYLDILKLAPLLNTFVLLDSSGNNN